MYTTRTAGLLCAGEKTSLLNSDGAVLLTCYRIAVRWGLGFELVCEDVRF